MSLKEIKRGLISDRDNLKVEIDALNETLKQLNKSVSDISTKIENVEKAENITITDHALLRFVERVHGFDFDRLRSEIITDQVKNQIAILGDGKYPVNNKHYVVVKDGTIVTTYDI